MSFRTPDPSTWRMRKIPRLAMPLVATTVIAALLIAAFAQAQSVDDGPMAFPPPAPLDATAPAPAPDARISRRLTLTFATRTVAVNIAADARAAVTAATLRFPRNGSVMTERTRAGLDALRLALPKDAPGQQAFAILVSGKNGTLAHRRAQALRAEWIARRSFAAHHLVAAARVSDQASSADADDGAVRVEILPLDALNCGDCGQTGLRAIALDSAATKLVSARMDDDAAPIAAAAGSAATETTVLPPSRKLLEQKTAASDRAEPAKRLVPRVRRAAVETRQIAGTKARCPRPRIIIDDYWPGGPIVPCHGRYR